MLRNVLRDLAGGKPILLYDLDGREQETDMVIAGQFASPDRVATLRREAGGLICVAIPAAFADKLGLPYFHDMLKVCGSETLKGLSSGQTPYGGYPAFSVTLNHRETYTGITDMDRSKTIRKLSHLVGSMSRKEDNDWAAVLRDQFRSPGHVHVLIGSRLAERQGHTELSLELARMSGLPPAMVICEMLDDQTHKALAKEEAMRYARRHNLALVDAHEILAKTGVRL